MSLASNATISPQSSLDESFKTFFERWLSEQNSHLQDLTAAAAAAGDPEAAEVRPLVERVVEHYEKYYRVKARWVRRDAVAMLTPRWLSSLEDAFLWVGGWRPSMAFHLFYSKSGLQLQVAGRLSDLISGVASSVSGGDLADITPAQLSAVDDLQRRTIIEEREISEKLAEHQETVAGSELVELSHAATEVLGATNGSSFEEERVEAALKSKEKGFEEMLAKAEELRLKTLKAVVEVLTVAQAVHFLIAAAELHLRIHEWGVKKDSTNSTTNNNHAHHDPNQVIV